MKHQPVTSSDLKSADAAISAVGGYVHAIVLIPDGTNACSLVIYDNATTNSGIVLAKLVLPATQTAPQVVALNNPISANKGIYADVTGTGANYIVYYSQGI